MKFFISYRSLDSSKVDSIAAKLRGTVDANGQTLYSVWQDKHDIPDGHNWWDAIVDAIIGCDMFIFMVSKEACLSPICQSELRYAFLRNRPIIPIVLEGEYFHNDKTGKNDLLFWDDIPDELNARNAQFLFYEEAIFSQRLTNAIAEFQDAPHRWQDKKAPRPIDPRDKDDDKSDDVFDIYDKAVDYARRMEFQTAERYFLRLMNSADDTFQIEADKWIDIVRAYNTLKKFASRKTVQHRVPQEWEKYHTSHFPVEFIEGIFDPLGIGASLSQPAPTKPPVEEEEQKPKFRSRFQEKRKLAIDKIHPDALATLGIREVRKKYSGTKLDIFEMFKGTPFDLITIPEGNVTIEENTVNVETFLIGKYPITNAQFSKFVLANGYINSAWWTDAGWAVRKENNWNHPRFWQESKWNGDLQPVVGISWYEAVAFCLWLSDVTGDEIMLPTEQQWQRAAQGDDGRTYPWGNDWDSKKCRNSVDGGWGSAENTSPVQQYEGKGDSFFGVVDMAGNVWEWCRTAYTTGSQDINGTDVRVWRGGSWNNDITDLFRCINRYRDLPQNRFEYYGFRVSRIY